VRLGVIVAKTAHENLAAARRDDFGATLIMRAAENLAVRVVIRGREIGSAERGGGGCHVGLKNVLPGSVVAEETD
jgi:hypothetical protein